MALKLKADKLFKANVLIGGELDKEVTFRLPRTIDLYSSADGNQLTNTLYTISNMAKPFEKPIQIENVDGSILNIMTLKDLVSLGVEIDLTDVIEKWSEAREESESEKERLTKKSELAGNSTKKATK